jgi:hypothetical protein
VGAVVVYLTSGHDAARHPVRAGRRGRRELQPGAAVLLRDQWLSVVGLLMGGWSSFNKYSLLGGLRSAAQVVSYEIPLVPVRRGRDPDRGDDGPDNHRPEPVGWFTDWYIWQQPLGFLIFFIAATAEANRTPFDLTEADSEIVAGFATEYSGMRFGFFFFAEYVNVFIISALTVTLFFGGWNAPIAMARQWAINLSINPGSLGIALLLIVLHRPARPDLVFATPSGSSAPGSRPGRHCSAASCSPTCS